MRFADAQSAKFPISERKQSPFTTSLPAAFVKSGKPPNLRKSVLRKSCELGNSLESLRTIEIQKPQECQKDLDEVFELDKQESVKDEIKPKPAARSEEEGNVFILSGLYLIETLSNDVLKQFLLATVSHNREDSISILYRSLIGDVGIVKYGSLKGKS